MKKFFNKYSHYSMMRLLSFVAVLFGVSLGSIIIVMCFLEMNILYIKELIYLCGTFLGFGFGGKVVQKFGEKGMKDVV